MDFIWSDAAFAADMAELNFLAAMTEAPLFWTVGRKVVFNHSSSLTTSGAGLPPMVALAASGNCVEEWLPQMMTFLTLVTAAPVLRANWAAARFWSNLVMAEKLSLGILGA